MTTKVKKVRAWIVERDGIFPVAEIVERDADCGCHAFTYDAFPIFRTKKEAFSYSLSSEKVVPIILSLPHTPKRPVSKKKV